MRQIAFGRLESLRIENGELVLNPWPKTIRDVKFGTEDRSAPLTVPAEFELKRQVIELFEYVRAVDGGEILTLEIRHGLPFSMEIELAEAPPTVAGGGRG